MRRDDQFIGHLEAYLREYEGMTPLPGAVRDAVRAELPATRQRGLLGGPMRRFLEMNKSLVRVGMASAGIVLIVFVGMRYLPDDFGLDANPTPVSTSTSIPSQDPGTDPALTRTIQPFAAPNDFINVTYAQPMSWSSLSDGCVYGGTGYLGPEGMGICFSAPTGLYSDPCHADTIGQPDVAVGPTVDDLADALGAQPAYEAAAPSDVTLSGYSGKRIDLQLPDSNFATCDAGGHFYPWDGSTYPRGPNARWHLWILDIDGARVVINAYDFPGTSTQDQEEPQAIVESFRIEPFRGWPAGGKAGPYSWQPPCECFMHNLAKGIGDGEEIFITFSASANAYGSGPTPVTVAGYDGTHQKLPIDADGSRREVWIVVIEGTRVTITLKSGSKASAAQLAEAHGIIESIRYEPQATAAGYVLIFTIPEGWDSG